jgi:hypothetical protein
LTKTFWGHFFYTSLSLRKKFCPRTPGRILDPETRKLQCTKEQSC